MSVPAATPRRRSRTTPSSSDLVFAAVGALAFLAASFTIPPPRADLSGRLIALAAMLAFGGFVVGLPALLLRGSRGDWRGFTVWCAKGWLALAALVMAAYVREATRNQPSSLIESLRTGQITIDRFVRAERAAAPGMFDQRLLANNERALRQSFPDGTFSDVSLAGVSAGDGWMRVHMTYVGVLSVQGESVDTRGQMVIYYHRAGTAVIGAACTADVKACAQIEPLLASAEEALRGRFDRADLDEVLPPSRMCSVETVTLPISDKPTAVRACIYAPGTQLTLNRIGAAATIASLIAERSAAE